MYVLELAGEDDRFAAAEARATAVGVEVIAPGLATARAVDQDRLRGLAYTRRAGVVIGRSDASVDGVRAVLAASSIDRTGSAAVRARDVRRTAGVDTQRAERALGAVLADRGLEIDLEAPDHELRALFSADVGVLAWLSVEPRREFGARAPTDKPFFQPGSMDPLDARAVANLAGAAPGVAVLDPMCGTGGVLVEAGLVGADVIGVDSQARMVAGARENLRAYLEAFAVLRGDATALPVRGGAVDALVVDVPYGRQSKLETRGRGRDGNRERERTALVAGVLAEARRVADRAVLVGDRQWTAAAREADWTVEAVFERPVHRSLTRHVHVLATPQRAQ